MVCRRLLPRGAVVAASTGPSQSTVKSPAAPASQPAPNRSRANAVDSLLSDPSADWLDESLNTEAAPVGSFAKAASNR